MKKGYTLIEILIVTTIVVLLTAGAIVSYSTFLKQSRDAKRKADLEQIRAALEMYRSNNNEYLVFSGNCSSLVGLDEYLATIPSDPKRTSSGYYYRCTITANNYTLGAILEKGAEGTGGCNNCDNSPATGCNYCVGPYGLE